MPEHEDQALLLQKMAEKNKKSPYEYVFGSQDQFDVDALVLIISSEVESDMIEQEKQAEDFSSGKVFEE